MKENPRNLRQEWPLFMAYLLINGQNLWPRCNWEYNLDCTYDI